MVPLADVQIATGSVAAMSSTIIRSRRRTNVEKPVTAVIEQGSARTYVDVFGS